VEDGCSDVRSTTSVSRQRSVEKQHDRPCLYEREGWNTTSVEDEEVGGLLKE
jgi:hypothetical protein